MTDREWILRKTVTIGYLKIDKLSTGRNKNTQTRFLWSLLGMDNNRLKMKWTLRNVIDSKQQLNGSGKPINICKMLEWNQTTWQKEINSELWHWIILKSSQRETDKASGMRWSEEWKWQHGEKMKLICARNEKPTNQA